MVTKTGGGDEKRREIGTEFNDVEVSSLPIAPDGGIAPGFGIAPAAGPPAPSPENSVCLRGPCRHYWEMETDFDAGNPAGTFEALGLKEPRQKHRTCLRSPAAETTLGSFPVRACDQWDPMDRVSLDERERRREQYYARHPEHAPEVIIDSEENISDR
jgi:hypothetical protein